MEGLTPLWDVMPLSPTAAAPAQAERTGRPFTDIFENAIDAVRETDHQEAQLEYLFSTGQLDNPAVLTIAATKAGAAVDLLIQLRSKAMDAYNELMRISL